MKLLGAEVQADPRPAGPAYTAGDASLGVWLPSGVPPLRPVRGLLPAGSAREVTPRVFSTAWRGEELAAVRRCGGALSSCPSLDTPKHPESGLQERP